MGLDNGIIRLSPLIHEGEQRYKPYIVDDPLMVIRLSPLIHEGEQRYKPYIVGDPLMVSLL